jgi:hypothetical protein
MGISTPRATTEYGHFLWSRFCDPAFSIAGEEPVARHQQLPGVVENASHNWAEKTRRHARCGFDFRTYGVLEAERKWLN